MTDQGSRFRKTGIYTMEVRRRGARGLGTVPFTSPVGPVNLAPSSTVNPASSGGQVGDGMPAGQVNALAQTFYTARDLDWGSDRDSPMHLGMIGALLHALSLHPNSDGLVATGSVRNLITPPDLPTNLQHYVEMAFPSYPDFAGRTINSIIADIDNGFYIGSRTRQAQIDAAAAAYRAQQAADAAAAARAQAQATADAAAAQQAADAAQAAEVARHEALVAQQTANASVAEATGQTTPFSLPGWVVPVAATAGGAALGAVLVRALFR